MHIEPWEGALLPRTAWLLEGGVGLQEGGVQVSFLEFILGPGEGPLPRLVALIMHSSQRLATYYRS